MVDTPDRTCYDSEGISKIVYAKNDEAQMGISERVYTRAKGFMFDQPDHYREVVCEYVYSNYKEAA